MIRLQRRSLALAFQSVHHTLPMSSTYTAYMLGFWPGGFQVRQLRSATPKAGSCIDRLPQLHSLTQMRPRLSDHTSPHKLGTHTAPCGCFRVFRS